MSGLQVLRPATLAEALAQMQQGQQQGLEVAWLAGGQSLLAAMRLGMSAPALLIDLQDVPHLRQIKTAGDAAPEQAETIEIGAMLSHAALATDPRLQAFAPGLAQLAGGIADPQVRNMGTIGGSLANHDPAACWPAAVLACSASLQCSSGTRSADEFFTGMYGTALAADEILLAVRFPRPLQFGYYKFEQPASRFALVGVAVARFPAQVRVAITGLGSGVRRWPEAEQALTREWSLAALQGVQLDPALASADLHASAEYRAHLAALACRRILKTLDAPAGTLAPAAALPASPASSLAGTPAVVQAEGKMQPRATAEEGFGASVFLPATPERVWAALLDPQVLGACIPGCESLALQAPEHYVARLKVGIGPLSARFAGEVLLQDLQPPRQLNLVFKGSAGTLGGGQGDTRVRLQPLDGGTQLHWHARVEASGRLAQLGNRLLEGSARRLSEEFFAKLRQTLVAAAQPGESPAAPFSQAGSVKGGAHGPAVWRRWLARLKNYFASNRKE